MTAIAGVFIATFPVRSRSSPIRTLTSYLCRIISVIAGEIDWLDCHRGRARRGGLRQISPSRRSFAPLINCSAHYRVSEGNIASTIPLDLAPTNMSVYATQHTHPSQLIDAGVDVVNNQQAPSALQPEYHSANLCPPFRPKDDEAARAINDALANLGGSK